VSQKYCVMLPMVLHRALNKNQTVLSLSWQESRSFQQHFYDCTGYDTSRHITPFWACRPTICFCILAHWSGFSCTSVFLFLILHPMLINTWVVTVKLLFYHFYGLSLCVRTLNPAYTLYDWKTFILTWAVLWKTCRLFSIIVAKLLFCYIMWIVSSRVAHLSSCFVPFMIFLFENNFYISLLI